MSDLNSEIEERWRQRRKKAYNWPRLIAMLAVLIALIYGMGVLQKMGTRSAVPSAEVQDTTMVGSPVQAP